MKKAILILLVLGLCLCLCACGKYAKYDDLIGYIEAGDEENATKEFLALLEQNKPETTEPETTEPETTEPEITEPATTTVEITLDNWQDYFELVPGMAASRNAFDEIENAYNRWQISLKEEYRGRIANADVAFACTMSEYSECNFTHDLQTGQTTMSVISPSDLRGFDENDETCTFVYDGTTNQDSFYVGFSILITMNSNLSVEGNIVAWKGNEYANAEITRVQGSITLTAE